MIEHRVAQRDARTAPAAELCAAIGSAVSVGILKREYSARSLTLSPETGVENPVTCDRKMSEATAKQFWPNEDPLDPCVFLGSDRVCTQFVGVVANTVLWEITGEQGQIVYLPLGVDFGQEITSLEVRTAGDPGAMVDAVRKAMLSVSPDLPWVDIRPVALHLAPQLRSWRPGASMFTAFGILALSLAAVGMYGLVSYMAARRAYEIGVRKALGASDGGVIRLVLRGGLAMTLVGVVTGVAVAVVAGRLIADRTASRRATPS